MLFSSFRHDISGERLGETFSDPDWSLRGGIARLWNTFAER
jgi:hypothetical protein